jgi:hypothetical protein
MLKNLLITFICTVNFLFIFAQSEPNGRIRLSGAIRDENQKPVSYAHIRDLSMNEGWVSDYYGNFRADVVPGDSLLISAVSYHRASIHIPIEESGNEYNVEVILKTDTIMLKELVIHTWPATFSKLRQEFLEVEVENPDSQINLNLPSMKDLAAMLRTPGEPGQIGLYAGPGPFSILYDQFSREAKNRKNYEFEMKRERASARYNKIVVSKVTGLTKEEDLQKFMQYCSLQIKFILESTDYELYAAILNCYDEFCRSGILQSVEGK